MKIKLFQSVLLLVLSASNVWANPITFFEIDNNGSFNQPMGNYYYDSSNSNIVPLTTISSGSNREFFYPSFLIYPDSGNGFYWYAKFFTNGINGPLTPGFYQNSIGLEYESLGSGSFSPNSSTGSFEVLDINFVFHGSQPYPSYLERFAAKFEFGDGLSGRISYNSDAFSNQQDTPDVPEPPMMLLIGTVLLGMLGMKKRRKA